MGLADQLTKHAKPRYGMPCSVGRLLDTLDNPDREALLTMLADPSWTQPAIYKALVAEGYDVGMQTINRHRRGDCRCARNGQQ